MEELQQKVNSISQEIGLFQLNQLAKNEELEKRIKELEERLNTHEDWMKGFDSELKILENRIKTLEDSRQRQIALNATFAVKKNEAIEVPKPEIKNNYWPFFK